MRQRREAGRKRKPLRLPEVDTGRPGDGPDRRPQLDDAFTPVAMVEPSVHDGPGEIVQPDQLKSYVIDANGRRISIANGHFWSWIWPPDGAA